MYLYLKPIPYMIAGALAFEGVTGVSEQAQPLVAFFDLNFWLVLAHGAAGGSARWLFLREPWRDGIRLMLLGAVLASGVGNLWRLVVKNWLGDVPESLWSQPETAFSGAFVVGLLAVSIIGRFVDQKTEEEPNG